jgi:hypothetical protein
MLVRNVDFKAMEQAARCGTLMDEPAKDAQSEASRAGEACERRERAEADFARSSYVDDEPPCALVDCRVERMWAGVDGKDLVGPNSCVPEGSRLEAPELVPDEPGAPKSIWERLWDLIAMLEQRLAERVERYENLAKNQQVQSEQQECKNGFGKQVELTPHSQPSIEFQLQREMFDLQRLQDSIRQITTAVTNLQKADHDSKMAIVRNIA